MTKESLLDPIMQYAYECSDAAQVIPYSAAEKAMEEYARQQAIAFMSMADSQYSRRLSYTGYEKMYYQFIEQQNKQ